jgi:peptidoglycan L-alanyl-D-glutamate endopeptidase CwlK
VADAKKLQEVDKLVREKAIALGKEAEKRGMEIVVTDGFRSPLEQARLYEQGRAEPGAVVTWAKPGHSWHNFGKAFDIAFRVNGQVTWEGPWEDVGKIGEALGLEWGGRWAAKEDVCHFQLTGGKTTAQERCERGWKELDEEDGVQ